LKYYIKGQYPKVTLQEGTERKRYPETLSGSNYSPALGHFYFGSLGHYHFGVTGMIFTA
jgi:hypothetical protein